MSRADRAEHTVRRDRLIVVSAGFEARGGGRAAAGRLLAAAVRDFAVTTGRQVEALALGQSGSPIAETRYFGRSTWRLGLAAAFAQQRAPPAALAFDLLGLTRVQALLPRNLRCPYLVPLLGIEAWRPLRGHRLRALRGAHLVAISALTAQRAAVAQGISAPPVVHLALDSDSGGPASSSACGPISPQRDPHTVLVVGRLASSERYKGHDQLLDSIAALAPYHPAIRLVIVGEGDDRARLARRATALGIAGRVELPGFVAPGALAEHYARAGIFAMPSTGEGFGLVYLEAMRAGLPCIASRGSAAAEIVVDGSTGLLVDPEDRTTPSALTTALEQLLTTPELASRMGLAGQERERNVFSQAAFAAALRPHLESLVAASAGSRPSLSSRSGIDG